jgi:hypothetical protein
MMIDGIILGLDTVGEEMIEKEADDESHARSQTLIDNKAMVHS